MKRKLLLGFASVVMLAGTALNAQVVVRVGPPRAIVETRPVSPGPGYYWTAGYHRWDGNRYVWTPGAWALPPHPGARWYPHRYVRHGGGWVYREGYWR